MGVQHAARGLARALTGAGLVAGAAFAWGSLVERKLWVLRQESIVALPAGSTPLRVLHLSDLHLAPWQQQKIDWVRGLAALSPDLVVLTGDMLGHTAPSTIDRLGEALQPLLEAAPAVYVHGSNDYFGPVAKNPLKYLRAPSKRPTREPDLDTAKLEATLSGFGAVNLNNSATALTLAGQRVCLFGLGDPHIHYDDPEAMLAALAPVDEASPAVLRLGVVHAPYQRALNTLLARGAADVIFAGHTHGGQVRVPVVGSLTSNCDLPLQQARGLSVWFDAERAAFLNVSAGLGTSIYAPVRFACRPEVTLLTIDSADS